MPLRRRGGGGGSRFPRDRPRPAPGGHRYV